MVDSGNGVPVVFGGDVSRADSITDIMLVVLSNPALYAFVYGVLHGGTAHQELERLPDVRSVMEGIISVDVGTVWADNHYGDDDELLCLFMQAARLNPNAPSLPYGDKNSPSYWSRLDDERLSGIVPIMRHAFDCTFDVIRMVQYIIDNDELIHRVWYREVYGVKSSDNALKYGLNVALSTEEPIYIPFEGFRFASNLITVLSLLVNESSKAHVLIHNMLGDDVTFSEVFLNVLAGLTVVRPESDGDFITGIMGKYDEYPWDNVYSTSLTDSFTPGAGWVRMFDYIDYPHIDTGTGEIIMKSDTMTHTSSDDGVATWRNIQTVFGLYLQPLAHEYRITNMDTIRHIIDNEPRGTMVILRRLLAGEQECMGTGTYTDPWNILAPMMMPAVYGIPLTDDDVITDEGIPGLFPPSQKVLTIGSLTPDDVQRLTITNRTRLLEAARIIDELSDTLMDNPEWQFRTIENNQKILVYNTPRIIDLVTRLLNIIMVRTGVHQCTMLTIIDNHERTTVHGNAGDMPLMDAHVDNEPLDGNKHVITVDDAHVKLLGTPGFTSRIIIPETGNILKSEYRYTTEPASEPSGTINDPITRDLMYSWSMAYLTRLIITLGTTTQRLERTPTDEELISIIQPSSMSSPLNVTVQNTIYMLTAHPGK